jgi:PAS domain S-box-containing protein
MKGKEDISLRTAKTDLSKHLPSQILEYINDMAVVCDINANLQILYANNKFKLNFPKGQGTILQLIRTPFHKVFMENLGYLVENGRHDIFMVEMDPEGICCELKAEYLDASLLLIRLSPCNDHNWIFKSGELEYIFDDVQEQLDFGTWVNDISQGKLLWSDGMFRLLDLDKSIAVPYVSEEFYMTFVAPEDLDMFRKKGEEFLRSKQDMEHIYSIISAKGIRKIILMKLCRLHHSENGTERYLCINKDITHRTLLTEQLKSSNEALAKKEALFNFGTWEFDMISREFLWSDGMYCLYGYDPAVYRGKLDLNLEIIRKHISDAELTRLENLYKKLDTDKPDSFTYDYTIVTNDGKVKKLESVLKIERDEQGAAIKVYGNTRDITEKDQLMFELIRYRQMIQEKEEFLGQGSYEFDIKSKKSTVSEGLLKIYGYKGSADAHNIDLLGLFNKHFSDEEREKVLSSFKNLIERGGEDVIQVTALVDGREKNLEVYAKVYLDPDGAFHRIVGTTRDVTTLKKLYNELLEFKDEIIEREILLKHGTWELDLQTNTVSMSDGLYDLIGIDKDLDPVKVSYLLDNFLPQDEEERVSKLLEEVISGGVAYADDIGIKSRSGELIYLEFFARLVKNDQGIPERILGIARDTTRVQTYKQELKDQVLKADQMNQELSEAKQDLEQKLSELEMVNNELQLYKQTMLDKDEFLNQGTWEWNVSENTFDYSRGMYRLFGYYSREEMKQWESNGNNVNLHMDEEEQKRSDEDWQKILSEADTYLREMEITTHDGVKRKLETFGKVFRDDEGNAYKVIGTTRDITQLKEYEQELEVKIDELNRSNKDLEEFAYIASHDLHEPLRKLSTFGQRLTQSAMQEMSPQNMDYLGRMIKAAETMRNLIDNLLEFSRVTRGSATYIKQELGKIIEEVVFEQELRIEETGAKVVIEKMPQMELISPQIKQLFNNLLSNALKFVRADVQPQISFTCRSATHEEKNMYRLKQHREYFCISVIDNGIGFEKVYADRIFQIFQRLHGKAEYTGSGIGLAICRKIVENHKGVIFAESEPGKGSTFTVILPNKP